MPKTRTKTESVTHKQIRKYLTGIKGFDLITEGGLPRNRTTLISGSAGTRKTLLVGQGILAKQPTSKE